MSGVPESSADWLGQEEGFWKVNLIPLAGVERMKTCAGLVTRPSLPAQSVGWEPPYLLFFKSTFRP